MNNYQIKGLLDSHPETKNVIVGVYAADRLPSGRRQNRPCAYVVNTDTSDGPGEHWICLFFSKIEPPEYFDSYGRIPSVAIEAFLGETTVYLRNNCVIQSPLSTACGQHVIHYILNRCRGYSMKNIIGRYCGYNLWKNDMMVNSFVEKNFLTKINVIDYSYLLEQLMFLRNK